MAQAVPPGGNWKDIPPSIPSARLDQIRESFAAGKGSRSTYYGRLSPDRPAYTIGTYYNRPGNGCFLHHDYAGGQHRTLSHREAARLQSFPDNFEFGGSQRAICQQIGNAVPPLLAFQIAKTLGEPGFAIDLFCGAGGLALGFEWAGWESIAAVDSDRSAVETFNENVSDVAFAGDLTDPLVHTRLRAASANRTGRLALIGGPPCQGFSTGGKKRSAEDLRNRLHENYAQTLRILRPDVFVFENVTGLLSIDGGNFVRKVRVGFEAAGYDTVLWRLNAAHFGVPQRRERVVIIGLPRGSQLPAEPTAITGPLQSGTLDQPATPNVRQALDDLPGLCSGMDGTALHYRRRCETHYQSLMRGEITPDMYLQGLDTNDHSQPQAALSSLARVA